jgi:hypothetical protein
MIDDVTGGDGGTLSSNAVPTDSALRIELMAVSEFALELAAVTLRTTHTKAS